MIVEGIVFWCCFYPESWVRISCVRTALHDFLMLLCLFFCLVLYTLLLLFKFSLLPSSKIADNWLRKYYCHVEYVWFCWARSSRLLLSDAPSIKQKKKIMTNHYHPQFLSSFHFPWSILKSYFSLTSKSMLEAILTLLATFCLHILLSAAL